MNKTKLLSVFMAALFFMNAAPIFLFPQKLKAATAMQANFYGNLITTDGTDTPKLNYAPEFLTTDTIVLQYSVYRTAGLTLTYLLDSRTRINFTIKNISGDLYSAEYTTQSLNADNTTWGAASVFKPTIYSYNKEKTYIPAKEYQTIVGSNENYKINGDETLGYTFEFKQGFGFSFKFEGVSVYFLIDTDGNLQYTTNKLAAGTVYNFYLLNSLSKIDGQIQAFTGIDKSTVDFIPYADDLPGNKGTEVLSNAGNDNVMHIVNNGYVLDYTAVPPEIPAKNVGMAIRFNEPLELSFSTSGDTITYTPSYAAPSVSDFKMNVEFNMYHNLSDIGNQMRITVEDIYALPTAVYDTAKPFVTITPAVPPATEPTITRIGKVEYTANSGITINEEKVFARFLGTDNGTGTVTSTLNPRRVEIRIGGLEPGMLFSGVSVMGKAIKSTGTTACANKDQYGLSIDFGKAFTFLSYTFNYDGIDFSLQFTPYRKYAGVYTVHTGPTSQTHETKDGSGFVDITLPSLISNTYYIEFTPNTSGNISNPYIYSEKTLYNPEKAIVSLGAARDFKIDQYRLKPEMYYSAPAVYGSTGKLDLKLSWQIGLQDAIDMMLKASSNVPADQKVYIKYDLLKSLTGNNDRDTQTKWGSVILTIVKTQTTAGAYEYRVNYELYKPEFSFEFDSGAVYDPTLPANEAMRLTDINGNLLGAIDQVLKPENGMLRFTLDIIDLQATHGPNATELMDKTRATHFYYEKVYFLAIETKPQVLEINKTSNFDSMSLSAITRPEVPPVRDLKTISQFVNFNEIGFTWAVPIDQLTNYFFLTPYEPSKAEYRYNIFISQDEALMKSLAAQPKDKILEKVELYDFPSIGTVPLDESVFTIKIPTSTDPDSILTKLRDDKIIMISGMEVAKNKIVDAIAAGSRDFYYNLKIEGLDKNQTYYIYVSMEITHTDPADFEIPGSSPTENFEADIQTSILSILHAITTKNDGDEPTGEDRRPPAPIVLIREVAIDTATVYWEYADIPAVPVVGEPYEKVHYEVIRTKGKQIPTKFVDAYMEFPNLYTELLKEMPNTEMVILRTPDDNPINSTKLVQFDPLTGAFTIDVEEEDFELALTEVNVEIKDNTLTSNEIYFYYVRTVRTTKLGRTLYSVFNYNTCTTDPVAPPINLVILDKDDTSVAFNNKTEIVFNFDAPFATLEPLGTQFNIEYAIKVDDAEFSEPIVLDPDFLKNHSVKSTTLQDYYNFTYKLSNLTQGTMYTIRVRITNIATKDTSSWSNTARTRTEMDQEDYFNDKAADAWLQYYRDLLTVTVQDTYWVMQDSKTRFTAVYRPTMFAGVLAGAADARVVLPVGTEGASTFVYYLPATTLEEANDAQKGFVSTFKNMEVIISPKTINPATNEPIFAMLEKIAKNTYKDYYVMISIEYKTYNQNVGSQPPLSENMVISFDLVGAKETAKTFDNVTLAAYMTEIEKEVAVASVRKRIIEMLEKETQSEEIIKYLVSLTDKFKSSMASKTYSSFKAGTSGSTSIKTLDASIIVSLKAADITTNATGYQWNAGWVAVDTIAFGAGKAFYTNLPGSYIFAGVKIVIDGAATLPGAATAYTIIGKYSLTDFIGVEGNINLSAVATRNMVLGSAARMMGAPKGSNAIEFFKTKGYVISGAGADSAATTQESIYVIMAVYEAKTNTKVSTLQIKNYNALANVAGLNDRYKPYIRAAFELGIYNNPNMQPRATITVKDLLDLLTSLDIRAKL